jgi:hypothetical protein
LLGEPAETLPGPDSGIATKPLEIKTQEAI